MFGNLPSARLYSGEKPAGAVQLCFHAELALFSRSSFTTQLQLSGEARHHVEELSLKMFAG